MKFSVTVQLAAGTLAAWAVWLALPAIGAETNSPAPVQVTVVKVRNACFSAAIRVTGFLVAREEARVTLDQPGYKITEILVSEGDRVTSGQVLARLTRLSNDAPAPDSAPGRNTGAPAPARTATLKAPVAGTITRSTAT